MKNRVRIPKHHGQELLTLIQQVRARHEAEGDESPLRILDWNALNQLINDAAALEEQAHHLRREKLRVYQQRALRQHEIKLRVRGIRDLLTGIYSEERKALGMWGFDVLDSRTIRTSTETPVAMKAA